MNKKYKVAIIGLGYVGLGLTVEFSKISKIVGFDKSNKRIIDLKNGKDITFKIYVSLSHPPGELQGAQTQTIVYC